MKGMDMEQRTLSVDYQTEGRRIRVERTLLEPARRYVAFLYVPAGVYVAHGPTWEAAARNVESEERMVQAEHRKAIPPLA